MKQASKQRDGWLIQTNEKKKRGMTQSNGRLPRQEPAYIPCQVQFRQRTIGVGGWECVWMLTCFSQRVLPFANFS
ncbi:hypothetical protein BaRGS_00028266 [Batillaria attramentaria]|uniref:Uncharacterized protein n=1 Tax=Batillaria attramentaria TaxID=370345 RepID=A0ABD0JZQ8_9CAEN